MKMDSRNSATEEDLENFYQTVQAIDPKVIVIGGYAKTGTTLPLTLLDSHPELVVFPEELRFFHVGCEFSDNGAADRFFKNANTQRLSMGKHDFGYSNYKEHSGTGFGKIDYSAIDFDLFESLVRYCFKRANNAREKFFSIAAAYISASGRNVPDKFTFVCKAPHNELYPQKWVSMLGDAGKYIICTRDPVEHYFSLGNVSKLYEKKNAGVYEYINVIRRRLRLWDNFPENQLFVLDYDSLVSSPRDTISKVAEFIGISFDECLLRPTKNGVEWSGNSSRGIASSTVFQNPHVARTKLPARDVRRIEVGLYEFMQKQGYEVGPPPSSSEMIIEKSWLGIKSLGSAIDSIPKKIKFYRRRLLRKLGLRK